MATTLTNNDYAIANALWTMIKGQNRSVRAYIGDMIKRSMTVNQNTSIDNKSTSTITPFVRSLGVALDLDENFDEKQAYRDHLTNKYR